MNLSADFSSTSTPASLGFRMPAEWEPHAATWLAWPHNQETWPGDRLVKVQASYLIMIQALLENEDVHLLLSDEREQENVRQALRERGAKQENLRLHAVETADAWIRDYGPTFLKGRKGEKAWCKWIFNAWGAKYRRQLNDNSTFAPSKNLISGTCFAADFILEGGSIDVNGSGTCMTTEQCLLNSNRNAAMSRTQIEALLRAHLGVSNIVWLKEGIAGDDTDGHIDDIARFTGPDTITAAFEDDPDDENYPILNANWQRLLDARSEQGKSWNLIKLPMPSKVGDEGTRLPASYANFYIGNGIVLLPAFADKRDDEAAAILKDQFPTRRIVQVPCRELVYGLGAIHCVTQQEPE